MGRIQHANACLFLKNFIADCPTLEHIRQEEVKSSRLRLKVIEQDGEKFVVLPDSVLDQCGIGDVVDISVKDH